MSLLFVSDCSQYLSVDRLPFSVRVLLESAVRNCDQFTLRKKDVENIMRWEVNRGNNVEIPFKPSRVIMQDFTLVAKKAFVCLPFVA